MPDRLSVGIGDFRIIYDARNAVRVFNGVSGVVIEPRYTELLNLVNEEILQLQEQLYQCLLPE